MYLRNTFHAEFLFVVPVTAITVAKDNKVSQRFGKQWPIIESLKRSFVGFTLFHSIWTLQMKHILRRFPLFYIQPSQLLRWRPSPCLEACFSSNLGALRPSRHRTHWLHWPGTVVVVVGFLTWTTTNPRGDIFSSRDIISHLQELPFPLR